MTTLTQTTELEAVNTMLHCINQGPVSALEDAGNIDVAKSRALLAEVSRRVQTRGWNFNTETDYPMARNVALKIPVPTNVLQIDTTAQYGTYEVAHRGGFLYWKNEHTFEFDKDLEVDVTFYLPFTDLPQSARDYITIVAARIFQARQLGSDTKHKFSEADEMMALVNMKATEATDSDANMLTDSWAVYRILAR